MLTSKSDFVKPRDQDAWAPMHTSLSGTASNLLDTMLENLATPAIKSLSILSVHTLSPTSSLSTTVQASRDPIISSTTPDVLLHPNVVTINTAFDWNLDVNKKTCYSKSSQAERIQVTERERHFASQATCPITIQTFESAVSVPIFFWKRWLIFLKAQRTTTGWLQRK